jgi:hypothetical protein
MQQRLPPRATSILPHAPNINIRINTHPVGDAALHERRARRRRPAALHRLQERPGGARRQGQGLHQPDELGGLVVGQRSCHQGVDVALVGPAMDHRFGGGCWRWFDGCCTGRSTAAQRGDAKRRYSARVCDSPAMVMPARLWACCRSGPRSAPTNASNRAKPAAALPLTA